MLLRAAILGVILGLLGGAAAWRGAIAPAAWWNWCALALALGALAILFVDTKRKRARLLQGLAQKPRWYQFGASGLSLLAIGLLSAWWLARVPAPMGTGPAGPSVDASEFAKLWLDQPVVMVSLGDSVSTGYGAGPGMGYFDLIQRNVDSAYPEMSGVDLSRALNITSVQRLAANSTNSIEHEETIARMHVRTAEVFGVVCLTTGGIDLIHWYGKSTPKEGAMYGADWTTAEPWIRNFEQRLDRMLLALRDKFPGGCAVFLATIYDPTDTVGDIENAGPKFWLPAWPDGKRVHTAFNDIINAAAAKHDHVHLVDLHQTLLGHGIHCNEPGNPHYDASDPTYWYYINLEDPNQRGYDAIRRAFLNAMAGALAGKRK